MTLLIALLLWAAPPERETIEPVTVAPGKYRNLAIRIDHVPYRVQVEFRVLEGGPKVRALLLRNEEAVKFWHKEVFRAEAATSYEREGFLGWWVTEPGEYELVIDNRLEARASARVELNVGYVRGTPVEQAGRLSQETRHRVVVLSLVLFACIATPAGIAVMRAFRRRQQWPAA